MSSGQWRPFCLGLYVLTRPRVLCATISLRVPSQLWEVIDDANIFSFRKPKLWSTTNVEHIVNTFRPRQNGRHFTDDILKYIFLNNVRILITISLKFVPKDPIKNISALVQIMASRRPGNTPLSEPMMVSLLIHICVTRLQWVKFASKDEYIRTSSHIFQLTSIAP